VSKDAGTEPRNVTTSALAVRRSSHSALNLIQLINTAIVPEPGDNAICAIIYDTKGFVLFPFFADQKVYYITVKGKCF
jgi:hypothetical protein